MEWSHQTDAADWWISRLRPSHEHMVGSVMPSGFEAVTRIFHPIEDDDDDTILHRWTDVARANGRTPHPEMQLHRIVSTPGEQRHFQDVPWVDMGHLPPAERRFLADILQEWGSREPTWFGYSDINSGLDDRDPDLPPRTGTFSRQYFLVKASLAEIDDVSRFAVQAAHPANDWLTRSPNLWWPDDHRWFVVSEVDFMWTYVGGPQALIEAIESSPDLEALRSDYFHQGHCDADTINGP